MFLGHETKREKGVAIICGKRAAQDILGFEAISDRLISATKS